MYQTGMILILLRNIYGIPLVVNPVEPYKPGTARLLNDESYFQNAQNFANKCLI
jgi:hypothetical protein